MYDAKAVARTMIDRATELGLTMTNLKLQKLLYIAHGTMLATNEKALVDKNFSAWKYGPVLDQIYHDLKVFGSDAISSNDNYIQRWGTINPNDEKAYEVIDAVLDHFGKWSGARLIEWSHNTDGPWYAVYKDSSKNLEIPNEQIASYFKEKVISSSEPQHA